MQKEFIKAKKELTEKEFNEHYKIIFNKPVLDYVKTLVFNLPASCYCNCDYCIDENLRKTKQSNFKDYINISRSVLEAFPNINRITITGGTLPSEYFNELVDLINSYFTDISITWNTNGVNITEDYNTDSFNHINLHRYSVNDTVNYSFFKTNKKILSLKEAKKLFKDKLSIRCVVTKSFDFEEFINQNIPLFLNRLIPPSEDSDKLFYDILGMIDLKEDYDRRRNNFYYDGEYNNLPIRMSKGDELYNHIPNREPVFLNVCIVHRSGIVSGTWFEDDKVLWDGDYFLK